MKVVAHLDPVVLEGELLRRIGEVQERNGKTAPVLVVVPTARLVEHLQRRMAQKFDALLGVEIMHFRGLAGRILEAAGSDLQPASSQILAELLRRCIHRLPDDDRLRRFVSKRPGATSSLMKSINNLREAGFPEKESGQLPGNLAALYRSYCRSVDRLAQQGITDEAGFITRACEAMERSSGLREQYGEVLLYGAYELLGVHLQLLRMFRPVTALLPFDPEGDSQAGNYAERFARRFLLDDGDEPEAVLAPVAGGLAGERLSALYNESSRPDPLLPDSIFMDDFQGGATEVNWAVRRALALGADPREICILARDLTRYGPALETALDGVPFTSSLRSPLRRDPVVHDVLVLLEAVADDFPRTPTVELLSSPRIDWRRLGGGEPDGAAADTWSRRAGILGGLESWTANLSPEAGPIPELLGLLQRRFKVAAPATWTGQAERFRQMLELLPHQPDVAGLLDDMRSLDYLDSGDTVTPRDGLDWLRQAVDDSSLKPWVRDNGGIRVLDAMQARGLTFKHVFFIGFHSGYFPRTGREDPFLRDRIRRELEDRFRLPLPAGVGDGHEERLLLAQIVGSATDRLHVSWQRADDTGRSVSPSPALRELARLVLGTPDPDRLIKDRVQHRSVHPRARLDELAAETGMLNPNEANLLSAFSCEGRIPDPATAAGKLGLPHRTLTMLEGTERFRFGPTDWDGRIGIDAGRGELPWSATALEELGRCPLRFFFRRILRIDELEDELSPLDSAPKELGTAVHKLLELIYRDLYNEDLLAGGDTDTLKRRGRELLDLHRGQAFRSIQRRRADLVRPLWEIQEEIWLDAVKRFLDDDLPALAGLGFEALNLEEYVTRQVDLGEGKSLNIGGRFDRRIRFGDQVRVSDYKTSGKLDQRTNASQMLKGNQLQVPVYRLLLEGPSSVELLGVGPAYSNADEQDARLEFTGFDREDHEEGMRETVRVLAGLLERGLYPLRENSASCDYCAFKPGCRVNHPPTLEREYSASDGRDYTLLSTKNVYKGRTLLKDLDSREETG